MYLIQLKLVRFLCDLAELKSSPIAYLIMGCFLIAAYFLLKILFVQLNREPNVYWVLIFYAFLLFRLHAGRKDRRFIRLLTRRPATVFASEYLLLSAPLILMLLLSDYSRLAVVPAMVSVFAGIIPLNPAPRRTLLTSLHTVLRSYEWIGGIRSNLFLVAALLLFAIGTCFVPVLPLFVLLVFAIVCTTFYQENEPVELLCLGELPPGRFLAHKLGTAFRNYYTVCLPVLLLYLLFNTDTWWMVLPFVFLSACALVFCITLKYARYVPNTQRYDSLTAGIGLAGTVVPVLLPVTLFLCIHYYSLAIDNLDNYLYVYD